MSSRFVSGGTTDSKTGEIVPADQSTSTSAAPAAAAGGNANRSAEWAAVQAQVEEDRRRRQQQREEAARGGEGDKSLYEVLQANKAAKQAAFEEANKLKNQFRPLDDDEVEFLDGVRERKKAEEERLRRETEEGLRGFRELQSKISPSAEGAAGDEGAVEGGAWSVGRKRKRRKDEPEQLLKGLRRRSSATADAVEDMKAGERSRDGAAAEADQKASTSAAKDAQDTQGSEAKPAAAAAAAAAAKPNLSLVDYGSDDDSD